MHYHAHIWFRASVEFIVAEQCRPLLNKRRICVVCIAPVNDLDVCRWLKFKCNFFLKKMSRLFLGSIVVDLSMRLLWPSMFLV